MAWWSGYRRFFRVGGASRVISVPLVRCGPCRRTDVVLPAFVACGRFDVVESIGGGVEAVAVGLVGPARRLRFRYGRLLAGGAHDRLQQGPQEVEFHRRPELAPRPQHLDRHIVPGDRPLPMDHGDRVPPNRVEVKGSNAQQRPTPRVSSITDRTWSKGRPTRYRGRS